MRRYAGVLAGVALLAGMGGCGDARAEVEPLPPLERPSPERRAGLPEVAGRWIFTGFEYSVTDTARVREQVYQLTPPGEFRVLTQRLDSIAGRYVRDSVGFSFTGEVRRDGIYSFVVFEPTGEGRFVSGHVLRDTMWVELTGLPSSSTWPPRTRAALVRAPRGAPFTRLRGFVPPPDTTGVDSAIAVPPAATGEAPVSPAPVSPPPSAPARPAPAPPSSPQWGNPQWERPRDTVRVAPPPPAEPEPIQPEPLPPEPVVPPPPPPPDPTQLPRPAPRETIRLGVPSR